MPGPRSDSNEGNPARAEWYALVERFPVATPELLSGRGLTSRVDTKFLLTPRGAMSLLQQLWPKYAVLAAPLQALGAYHTLYFDTNGLDLFEAHRRGRRVRHKVRVRHYLDRKLSTLEVKTRMNEMRTAKVMRPREYRDDRLTQDDQDFLAAQTGLLPPFIPQVWTRYRRLTLFGIDSHERVTLDLDFQVDSGGRSHHFERLALLEVKQAALQRRTPVMRALRRRGWRSGWASKYCIGIAYTHPEVRLTGLGTVLRDFDRRAA